MHFTFDARYLTPAPSGIKRYSEAILTYLLETVPDLQLHLILRNSPLPSLCTRYPERITTQIFAAEPNSIRTRLHLAKALTHRKSDLFHSPFNILPANLPLPRVMTLHDIMWLIDPSLCTDILWRKLITGTFYRTLIPRSVEDADIILTVSHFQKHQIIERFPHTDGRVHVSSNVVRGEFRPLEEDQRHNAWEAIAHIVPSHQPFILMIGQNSPYKNHLRALKAFQIAFKEQPDMHLVFISQFSRSNQQPYREILNHSSMRGRIHTPSSLPFNTLITLYQTATAFLFPSIHEGFGIPIIEAMACGTPVLTSNIGAMNEIAKDAALTVNPFDVDAIVQGLIEITENASLRRSLTQNGIRRSRDFTPKNAFQDLYPILASLVQG